jgi:hypothetical protein
MRDAVADETRLVIALDPEVKRVTTSYQPPPFPSLRELFGPILVVAAD